ncbi:hypothetical protein MUG91_G19n139 [Manis pentadactyla]|nr:hypothetical protein MUG91_G19n139 [Manis pentadactyla]
MEMTRDQRDPQERALEGCVTCKPRTDPDLARKLYLSDANEEGKQRHIISKCTSQVLKSVTPICKTATSFSMLLIGDITKSNDTFIALDMAVLSKKRHTN